MGSLGKILIVGGLLLAGLGLYFVAGGKLQWLGRLPGDIYIQKKNMTLFFPITTSIVISILLSVIMIFLRRR